MFSACKLKQKELEEKKKREKIIREKKLRGEELTEEDLKEPKKLLKPSLDKSIVDAWRKFNKRNITDDKIWKTIINDACKSYTKLKNIIKKATEK